MSNVTGICFPCADLLGCGKLAHSIDVKSDLIKIGKEFGVWYVIRVFNRG